MHCSIRVFLTECMENIPVSLYKNATRYVCFSREKCPARANNAAVFPRVHVLPRLVSPSFSRPPPFVRLLFKAGGLAARAVGGGCVSVLRCSIIGREGGGGGASGERHAHVAHYFSHHVFSRFSSPSLLPSPLSPLSPCRTTH